MTNEAAVKEKTSVALVSLFAAVLLTGSKTVIGLLTGSLGILAEALHSGLDLVATIITYFSVRVSDKPPDREHQFGHGKIENLSALIETMLLVVTCAWIIYEAISRLASGRVLIEVNYWSYIVVVSSIVIDYSRSRALMKVAKKHHSQALEADALHFSTDIWSSAVVLLGLICANLQLHIADSIAALIVAIIVLYVCYKLGERSINVLLDRAPEGLEGTIDQAIAEVADITSVRDIRIRASGADVFIDMNITVEASLSVSQAHDIATQLEDAIRRRIPRSFVMLHQEPLAHPVSNDTPAEGA